MINRDFRISSLRTVVIQKLVGFEIDKKLDKLQSYLPDLNRYLEDYMLTGGIPKVIDEYVKLRRIPEAIYTTYIDVVLGDLTSMSRNETFFKQLIANIIKGIGWPASWRSLQKDIELEVQTQSYRLHFNIAGHVCFDSILSV